MPSADGIDGLEREIVDHLFELQPGYAVGLGLHEYDGRLPDLSAAETDRWATGADRLLARLASLSLESLSPDRQVDVFLLRLLLESPLFDLREARDLDQNPMVYVGSLSLTSYIAREYAPIADRVGAIVRILQRVPSFLEDGRARLRGPLPRPFVELALRMGEGLPSHFQEAEEFAGRAGLSANVARSRGPAEAALTEFLAWLRTEELPRAVPEFALGPERFQKLLSVREGISVPFEEIRRAGEADLAKNQARLAEIARGERTDPTSLFNRLGRDHPAAGEVLSTARGFVEEARQFVAENDLVSIPEPAVCRVEETPPYGRALTTASMNPPGPFDRVATEGIYFVTLVDPTWTPVQQEEWLRSLNRAMLKNITVHEVFPGHYLQFLHFRKNAGSLARKVYLSASFMEGWAHYTEQLAIEAGLDRGRADPEIAQLHDALLRDCRLLASVGLHTANWSLERATELFQREAHFERLPAEREAIRGTFNPEYFCYTLGKLAILEARSRVLGPKFAGNLRAFHDAVLAFGCPPIGLLGQLLGAQAPP